MADQHGWSLKLAGHLRHVVNIVRDTRPAQLLVPFACSVAAQAQSGRGIAVLSKIRQKVLIPTPGAMPRAVYKKQRYWMRIYFGIPCKNFQLHYRLILSPQRNVMGQSDCDAFVALRTYLLPDEVNFLLQPL